MNIVATAALVLIATTNAAAFIYVVTLGENLREIADEMLLIADEINSNAKEKAKKVRTFINDL